MVKCQRCDRKLTDPVSTERGYGPTCWEKEGQFKEIAKLEREVEQANEIAQLKRELAALKAVVHTMKTNTRPMAPPNGPANRPPVPNGNGDHLPTNPIPLMVGGWDPSELTAGTSEGSQLFLKLQAQAEAWS